MGRPVLEFQEFFTSLGKHYTDASTLAHVGVHMKHVGMSVAIILLLLAFFPMVTWDARGEPNVPPPPDVYGPKLVPEAEMPPYFIKHGQLPAFKDAAEERTWLEMLAKLGARLVGPDVPFWGTLVVAHGAGGDGYYWIFVGRSKVPEVISSVVATTVEAVNRAAKEIGFATDVPVKFAEATGLGGVDAARTDPWRPVIGGIQIQVKDQGDTGTGTSGWSAVRSGVKGFVIAGHSGYQRRVPVGTTVYQPTTPNYPTGPVTAVARQQAFADVAFVQFSNVAPKVFIGGVSMTFNFYQDPAVGNTVCKSGISTDITCGTVRYVMVDELGPSPWYDVLYDQAIADYYRATGDSGAPVYITITGYGRGVVGIHSGPSLTYLGYARFSPTSGVNTEVGAVPLTG
jgi:hypothetical protein